LLFTMQKALSLFMDGGPIILNASIVASKGLEAISVYSPIKAAVRSFARCWTTELKHRQIRVNVATIFVFRETRVSSLLAGIENFSCARIACTVATCVSSIALQEFGRNSGYCSRCEPEDHRACPSDASYPFIDSGGLITRCWSRTNPERGGWTSILGN
jgi:hypothetical protein